MADNNNEIKSTLSELRKDIHNIDKVLVEHKIAFENHTKQDESMMVELRRMNDILMDNTSSLKEHMQRTSLLEQAVMKMDERLSPIEIERIKKQAVNAWVMNNAVFIGKVFAGLAGLFGAYQAIKSLIH